VLVVAGVSVLLRDDDPGTVATSRVAQDSAATDSAATGSAATGSGEGGAERAVPPPVTSVAGPIEVLVYPDGSVAARVGATTTPPVRPGGLSAAVADGTVFGIAPATAGSVQIFADATPGVTRVTIADLVPASGEIRSFAVDGFDGVTGGIRVQAGGESVVLPGGAR
jgi:hypothetical protein